MQALRERLEKEFMKPESKTLDKMVELLTLTNDELEQECLKKAANEEVFQIESEKDKGKDHEEDDDYSVVSAPSSSDESEYRPARNFRNTRSPKTYHHVRMDGPSPSGSGQLVPKTELGL